MNLLLVYGEASSAQYAGELAAVAHTAGHRVFTIGGSPLPEPATALAQLNSHHHSVLLGQWRQKYAVRRQVASAIRQASLRMDRAVILDFPGYNNGIASILQRFKIPIITFITPNFWIWRQRRAAERIIRYSQAIITIHPQEYDWYCGLSQERTRVYYWGHPITVNAPLPQRAIHRELGIFPGSRVGEVTYNLPHMLGVVRHLPLPQPEVVIRCDHPDLYPVIQAILDRHGMATIPIQPWDARHTYAALSVPGTTTLFLALQQIPMIIMGRIPWHQYIMARYVLRMRIPYVGLPNIIANRALVTEFIQPSRRMIPAIAKALSPLLSAGTPQVDTRTPLQALLKAPDDYYTRVVEVVVGDASPQRQCNVVP